MRVQIYQINHDRDVHNMKFMSLKDGESVDASTYDEVFDAEIDETNLEDIYRRFNTERHPLHRGHSLSVSDVVVMNGKGHICQSFGFKEIPFDVSLTQKPDNLMRVVYVEPNIPAYEAEVEHNRFKEILVVFPCLFVNKRVYYIQYQSCSLLYSMKGIFHFMFTPLHHGVS